MAAAHAKGRVMSGIVRKASALGALAGVAFGLSACVSDGNMPRLSAPTGAYATLPLPPMRLFGPTPVTPPSRSNADMAQDFMDLSFRLETGRPMDAFSRFEGPISVAVAGSAPPTAIRDLDALLSRLRTEAGLPVYHTGGDAAITVTFLPVSVLRQAAPGAACFAAPRISTWADYRDATGATLDWTDYRLRQRVAIFIPDDAPPQEVRDCLNEELAQAIGPLDDLDRLPDTVFNDDNVTSVLTGFDMLMLRVTYDPDLRPGMSTLEVATRLPLILARLNPRGEHIAPAPVPDTPASYGAAIARAFGPGGTGGRLAAALRAVAIASPWNDHRTGFALLAAGRLGGPGEREAALRNFQSADAIFAARRLPLYQSHSRLQLSLMALGVGQFAEAEHLAASGIPAARQGQNAALLAGLMFVRSEALERLGRGAEAAAVRTEGLGWARYGIGADTAVRRRLQSIHELAVTGAGHPPATLAAAD